MNNLTDMMPFSKLMGVEVTEAGAERVAGALLVREELCTAGGILHGGAIMAFADALGAIGAFLTLPVGATGTTTVESKTNFLGAARVGTVVHGDATPVHVGKRTSVWQTRITGDNDKPVAIVIQTQLTLFP